MSRKSETLRLLEAMTVADLRRFAEYHTLKRGGAGSDLRRRLVGRLGTSLEALVSQRGPWAREDWNLLVEGLGGRAQDSFEDLRREIRRLLEKEPVTGPTPPLPDTGGTDSGTDTHTPEPPPTDPLFPPVLPTVGELINHRYCLLECLGAGGFGTAFSARDEKVPGASVVLKFANHAEAADSVLNEYQKAVNLSHPNICSYRHYDHSEEHGPFVVMQHGGLALAKLAASKGVELPLAFAILNQAAQALDFAHGQKIIHGDINPGNVLVDLHDNRVQLTDFGIAACIQSVLGTGGRETFVGTSVKGIHAQFGAPETRFGLLKPSSDQYSLALVFCVALQGMAKFIGPSQDIEGLSAAQQKVLARALQAAPEARFPSCAEFARAMVTEGQNGS